MTFKNYLYKAIVAAAMIAFFLSCQEDDSRMASMAPTLLKPVAESTEPVLKYTDSGYIKLKVSGRKLLDFANSTFPYKVFPDGITVTVYEDVKDTTKTTVITADKAYWYETTSLYDLIGNVVVINSDGNTYEGSQLYWDQKSKWVLTDQDYTIYLKKASDQRDLGEKKGSNLDANEKLDPVFIRNASDEFIVNQ